MDRWQAGIQRIHLFDYRQQKTILTEMVGWVDLHGQSNVYSYYPVYHDKQQQR